MRHILSITREQLVALVRPWESDPTSELPLMGGVSHSSRPVQVKLLHEKQQFAGEVRHEWCGTPAWLLRQRLDSGDQRALIFDVDGNVIAEHQSSSTHSMSHWVNRRTAHR